MNMNIMILVVGLVIKMSEDDCNCYTCKKQEYPYISHDEKCSCNCLCDDCIAKLEEMMKND